MLSSIQLKNFKSFKNLDDLKIKPITVLCGTNSCGKSSILQSLLLLKQNKESGNPNQSILLNGKYLNVGDIENIIYGHDKNTTMSLTYEYEFTREELFASIGDTQIEGMQFLSMLSVPMDIIEMRDTTYKLSFTVESKASQQKKGHINVADIHRYEASITIMTGDNELIPGGYVQVENIESGCKLNWSGLRSDFFESESFCLLGEVEGIVVEFENLLPDIKYNDEELADKIPNGVSTFFRAIDHFLRTVNSAYSYLGPLREGPQRRYIYENEVLEIGAKGENAAYIYQTEQQTAVTDHCFYDGDNDLFYKEKELTLKQSLAHWLELMNIKGFGPDFQSEIIRLNMNANSSNDTRVNIADVGFGVSQIFPILLEGLRMKKNGTLILEQPEIHLHPALQMQMADYFISLALSQKNVLVETHSDHVVNRLVRRIVEDGEHNLSEMVAIYFVSSGEDGSTIEEVKIDSNKGIVNWPQGFFDQTASEQEKIMMAGIKKRKANRSHKPS
ncbi:MAG: putative ATPase [Phenylobacterium sp.]|jgi:predicted ATPase